jgi:3-hydroxy-9,10-secoandrosta-1,3,5(10)-triene-9,17-dione monooxygenase reductase component
MDIAELKDAMSRFTTGVTVVTTHHDGADYGMTCNSFNTVSLDPPMVMWCIRKNSQSHAAFTAGSGYVVNVLAASQEALAMKFTQGSHAERFSGVDCDTTPSGKQRIEGAVAWFDCTLEQTVSAGDHDILIGQVQSVGTHEASGLVYARRQFGMLTPVVKSRV